MNFLCCEEIWTISDKSMVLNFPVTFIYSTNVPSLISVKISIHRNLIVRFLWIFFTSSPSLLRPICKSFWTSFQPKNVIFAICFQIGMLHFDFFDQIMKNEAIKMYMNQTTVISLLFGHIARVFMLFKYFEALRNVRFKRFKENQKLIQTFNASVFGLPIFFIEDFWDFCIKYILLMNRRKLVKNS